jgi:hypothetical protein
MAISKGQVKTMEEAREYLSGLGLTSLISTDVVRELINNAKKIGEALPMKGSLFGNIISGIQKSMGGGKTKGYTQDDPDPDDDDDDGDDLVNATDVIKALTDQVEELVRGQEEMVNSIRELAEMNKNDAEFKKSIGEGLIALMESTEKIAGSPAPRRGATSLNDAGLAGIQKGNLDGAARRHRQLTKNDRDELVPVICKAVEAGEMDIMDAGKLETQINKSIINPNFQIEPKLLAFLEAKWPKKATA